MLIQIVKLLNFFFPAHEFSVFTAIKLYNKKRSLLFSNLTNYIVIYKCKMIEKTNDGVKRYNFRALSLFIF